MHSALTDVYQPSKARASQMDTASTHSRSNPSQKTSNQTSRSANHSRPPSYYHHPQLHRTNRTEKIPLLRRTRKRKPPTSPPYISTTPSFHLTQMMLALQNQLPRPSSTASNKAIPSPPSPPKRPASSPGSACYSSVARSRDHSSSFQTHQTRQGQISTSQPASPP